MDKQCQQDNRILKSFLNKFSKGIDKVTILTKTDIEYQAILMDFDNEWIRLRVGLEEDGVDLGQTDIIIKISEMERIGECKQDES